MSFNVAVAPCGWKQNSNGGVSFLGPLTNLTWIVSNPIGFPTLSSILCLTDSPRRLWWYHWICWTLSAVGIFCILLAHDHYTVDVVVAYYITTRLFWWYHTMANQQVCRSYDTVPFSVTVHVRVDTNKCCLCLLSQSLKGTSQSNPFSKVWWYRLFQYFEENVSGTVPRNYQLPVSLRSQQWSRGVKYSKVDTQWHPPTSTRVEGQGIWLPWVLMWPKEDGTIRCSTVFFSSLGTDTSVWVALYPTYIFFLLFFSPYCRTCQHRALI